MSIYTILDKLKTIFNLKNIFFYLSQGISNKVSIREISYEISVYVSLKVFDIFFYIIVIKMEYLYS